MIPAGDPVSVAARRAFHHLAVTTARMFAEAVAVSVAVFVPTAAVCAVAGLRWFYALLAASGGWYAYMLVRGLPWMWRVYAYWRGELLAAYYDSVREQFKK